VDKKMTFEEGGNFASSAQNKVKSFIRLWQPRVIS